MPRKQLIRTDEHAYHVTARSNNRDWFSIPKNQVWKISKDSISIAHSKFPINIHSFVLMDNHYHLILDTPDSNIDSFMYELNKNFSLRLRRETGKINRMFGGRYNWSLITNQNYYFHVMKYVFRNPVKANITTKVQNYPYSTIYKNLKLSNFPGKVCPFINPFNYIDWFNESHSEHQNDSITQGLKKTSFKFAGSRLNRTPPIFEAMD